MMSHIVSRQNCQTLSPTLQEVVCWRRSPKSEWCHDMCCVGGAGLSNTNKDYKSLRASTGPATEPPLPSYQTVTPIQPVDYTIYIPITITITITPENLWLGTLQVVEIISFFKGWPYVWIVESDGGTKVHQWQGRCQSVRHTATTGTGRSVLMCIAAFWTKVFLIH